MTEAAIAGLVAGYGIAIPVGGMAVLIIMLSARTSLRTGLAGAMGTATADGVYALLAALAGAALITLLRPVARPMQWAGALILVLIGVKGVVAALRRPGVDARLDGNGKKPLRAYLELFGLTMLNPLTIVYFAALILAQQQTWSPPRAAVFVLAAFAASASWQAVLALGGAVVGRVLVSDRGRLLTALAGNGFIIVLAVRLFVSAL
ncbi:LysE family transporter [Amycolatopsis pigmentata]|uniref:LysE family transporter n=1 Tax=Amycolatopsis pigmentata TaxID=450801 RepID=A0ABW5FJZ6_9PSEU